MHSCCNILFFYDVWSYAKGNFIQNSNCKYFWKWVRNKKKRNPPFSPLPLPFRHAWPSQPASIPSPLLSLSPAADMRGPPVSFFSFPNCSLRTHAATTRVAPRSHDSPPCPALRPFWGASMPAALPLLIPLPFRSLARPNAHCRTAIGAATRRTSSRRTEPSRSALLPSVSSPFSPLSPAPFPTRFGHGRTRDGLLFLPVQTESKTVHRSSLLRWASGGWPWWSRRVLLPHRQQAPAPLSLSLFFFFSFFSFNPARSSEIQRLWVARTPSREVLLKRPRLHAYSTRSPRPTPDPDWKLI